jgi:hypothetical protein
MPPPATLPDAERAAARESIGANAVSSPSVAEERGESV